jgi:hypothetical protein
VPNLQVRPCFVFLAVAAVYLSLLSGARAQTRPSVRQDQPAVDVLIRALNAMGGSAAWAQVVDAEVSGTCSTPVPDNNGSLPSLSVRWTTQGKEFRYETDTANNGAIYLSGHGNPKIASISQPTNLAFDYGLKRLPFHLPGFQIAAALSNSSAHSLVVLGTDSVGGVSALHIHATEYLGTSKLEGSDQDWWFDPGSGLPVQVTYLLPSEDNSHYVHLTANFGGWTQEGGILVPLQHTVTFEGLFVIRACTFQTVQTNQNPAPATFDAR